MNRVTFFAILLLITGCAMQKENVDLLVMNARVYTVDENFSIAESFAVKEGRFVAVGSSEELQQRYRASKTLSLDGKYIYPGWFDPHCHFLGYGLSQHQVDLTSTTSVEEIVERCKTFAAQYHPAWITGRGWDQNDWEVKEFPDRQMLDRAFPDIPVLLNRIDGHAGWANTAALQKAGVTTQTSIAGGEVMMKKGEPTGILIDNAIQLVGAIIPKPGNAELERALLTAQTNCFAVGLTSVTDAGLETHEVKLIDSLQQAGVLKMRINAMLSPTESNFETFIEKGVFQNDYLTIGTLKLYADGALGSRGARMIEPYTDDPGNSGIFVTPAEEIRLLSKRAMDNNYQVAVHCIGDGANRQTLGIFGELLKGENDRRWRIEHAQIIHPDDFSLFRTYNIVPSIQATHATSDMYWAEERIGSERMEGGYSYKTLMEQNGWLPNGSDFPVEHINPLYGFHAAVCRKDQSGYPEAGFRIEEALTREEALRAMTIWAAMAGFEENFKGSIEVGKLADFVVTGQDLMTSEEIELPHIKVLNTYSGGILVYEQQ